MHSEESRSGSSQQAQAAVTRSGEDSIDLSISDGLAVLTLTNRGKLNALTGKMLNQDLPTACAEIAERDDISAVVLTGAEPGFCGGAARDGYLQELSRMDPDALGRPLGGFVLHLARLAKPTVAAINGTVAGGGIALAAVCDSRIGSPSSAFVSVYSRAGLVPDGGLTFTLPQLIGRSRSTQFFLTDESISAEEALDIGLLDEVIDANDLLERARQVAREFAGRDPALARQTKRLLLEPWVSELDAQIEKESAMQWARLRIAGAWASQRPGAGVDS